MNLRAQGSEASLRQTSEPMEMKPEMLDTSIETVRPNLKSHVALHDVEEGLGVLEVPGKSVLLLSGEELRLCRSFGGNRNLTEILSDASSAGHIVSVRSLLGLVTRLVNADALENREELATLLGLGTEAPFDPRYHRLPKGRGVLGGIFGGLTAGAGLQVPAKWLISAAILMAVAAISPWFTGQSVLQGSVENLQFAFDQLARSGQTLDLGATPAAALGALLLGYLFSITIGLAFRVTSLPTSARDAIHISLIPGGDRGPIGLSPAPLYRLGFRALRQGALLGIVGIALSSAILSIISRSMTEGALSDAVAIASFGGLVALLIAGRPFGRSECLQAFSNPFDGHDLAQHSRSYASTRYLRQVKDSDFAKGEAALVAFNFYRVFWIMLGFIAAKMVLLELVIPNFAEVQTTGRPLDWTLWVVVAAGAVIGIAAITFGFIISLARAIAGNLNRPVRLPAAQAPNFGQVSQALAHHPIFSILPSNALEELSKGTKLHDYAPSQLIIREDDPGDSFYMIARGHADVLVGVISGLESVVARLNPGDSFGEAALVTGEKRNATVRAIGDCSCFRINSDVFKQALNASGLEPEFVTPMLRSSSALRRSSVFKNMSPSSLRDLLGAAERKTWTKGTTLMREGDPGSQFYIVESGKLEVSQSGAVVGEVGPGDCVGELALLNDSPRSATVTVQNDSILLSLDRAQFQQIMFSDFRAGLELEQLASGRTSS